MAFSLPAAGAVGARLLRGRRTLAFSVGAGLGLAGVLVMLLAQPGEVSRQLGLPMQLTPAARTILAASALALGFVVLVAPRGIDRLSLLVAGLAALAALVAIAAGSRPAQAALLLLLLATGQSTLAGARPFAVRLRGPAFAVALLTGGALLAAYASAPAIAKLSAVLLVLGLAAAIGLLPFLHGLAPEEPLAASPIAWTAFVGPTLAVALPAQTFSLLNLISAPIYGAVLIGLGLFNVVWGGIGAWRAADDAVAWRHSFLADWGLALVGLGLLLPAGVAAAQLVLVSMLVVRLPLYMMVRPPRSGSEEQRLGPARLLVAACLAGAAPFAGFPARLLLLGAATDVYWPLALVLMPALLLWLPSSLRLARTIGRPRGRLAFGIAAAALISLGIGLYPAPLLAAFGGAA